MKNAALLAIDQGTSSSRAMLFSAWGEVLALRQRELALQYPHKGWVEQDPEDIWRDTLWALRGVLETHPEEAARIAGIGISNQRETTLIWDRRSGEAIYPAIVWQDRRTAEACAAMKAAGHEALVSARTGLLIDPYFSATKIAWILDHVEGARQRAEAGELAFGTVDSFLLWRLTGGAVHATDITNASRTLLYDSVARQWDQELLGLFGVPAALLPEVRDNAGEFGRVAAGLPGEGLPIRGIAGDQQAALIGQACFQAGMVKSTYGTGCFALMNIGEQFAVSRNRLLTSPAYRLEGRTTFALEGSIFSAGAALQWLRDKLGLFQDVAASEAEARSVPDNNGVYFVPAFTGLGAPHWRPDARAHISGLTRESSRAHIVRAALEAQAYQTLDLLQAMAADAGALPCSLRADGGLVRNAFVCQFLADMLDRPVEIPRNTEITAWGAACLAGLEAGVFRDVDSLASTWEAGRRYRPQLDAELRERYYQGWLQALAMGL